MFEVTFDIGYLEEAIFRDGQIRDFFADDEKGGYYMTAADGETLISRPKETYDGAIPSGNSVMALVLQRLAFLTGKKEWQEAVDRQMIFCAGEFYEYPIGYSFALLALSMAIYPHKELVCTVKKEASKE